MISLMLLIMETSDITIKSISNIFIENLESLKEEILQARQLQIHV